MLIDARIAEAVVLIVVAYRLAVDANKTGYAIDLDILILLPSSLTRISLRVAFSVVIVSLLFCQFCGRQKAQ
jgi:hypothetical protein